jgi:hypothetical protein
MKVFYKIVFLFAFIAPLGVMAQNNFFADKNASSFKTSSTQVRPIIPEKFRAVTLDVVSLKQLLKQVPMEFTADAVSKPVILSIPMPDGSISRFSVVESPIQEPGLMNKFQDIKTYSGQGIDDRTATIKLDWTDFGFHAQILSPINGSIYIDPYERGNVENYMSYAKKDLKPKNQFSELGIDVTDGTNIPDLGARTTAGFCLGTQLRTYRLAVACTGEYAVAVGATNATQLHSAIVTTVNRVNGVYEKEVAIRLVLVANNNLIEYLSAASDLFTGNNDANTLISESQSVITSRIGTANFDIGHTFSTGGGGLAGLGVVCNASNKARGITGSPQPTGDAYDIDFVAHEVGHQFGGNHTFNATTDNCSGNRTGSTSVEPGSGITIMGYAGICGSINDLANNSIPYFHTVSQGQIGSFSNNGGTGGSCAQITATGNSAPVVNAGSDYTIPAGTPFMLTGSATDANGDALTYSWEQIDNGPSGANWNSGNSPFFRSFAPTASPTRYFPRMSDILSGTQTIGEFLPTNSQTLNFRLTARDNRNGGSGVCSDEAVVSVVAGTAFTVTSQTSATSWTANGSNTADITWNAGNTASAPINATNVSILFSVDGGQTYPYTLVQSTPNDGSHTITIPAIATTSGKIMVKGANNIFFNINGGIISIINSVCSAEGASISPASSVNSTVGNPALNLNLTPLYSTPLAPSGTITSGSPQASLAVLNSNISSCQVYSNVFRYATHTFVVNQAAFYTFTLSANNGTVMTLYTGSYNPASPCANFIASNTQVSGSAIINATVSAVLVPNTTYVLAVGSFSATQPALPFNYNITITSNPGGSAFVGTGIFANPGANFSYGYVIIDNATNTIKAISSTADLSNSANYPTGSYTVYGISYLTANAAAINAYIGNNFGALTSSLATQPNTTCGNLSKNAVDVSISSAVVPVTFTALKARKLNSTVALEWGTLTETNSSHFVIERSTNGTNFTTTIGRVNAAGNSNAEKNYTLNDVTPIKGLGYYRVKQYDLDGRYTYSNVAAINFDKIASLLVVYPNPVKNTLNVEYTAIKGGKIELNIIDAKGAIVKQQTQTVVLGRNVHTMNVSNLAKGVYVIKTIDADKNVVYTKFIKD